MERPLKESRVLELNRFIMENMRTQAERNRLEAEIRAADLALAHYRKAMELGNKISA
jgi:hypothetical protein